MPNTYITHEDAINKLGSQLYRILDVAEGTDISGNPAFVSALDSANARVDSALRGRYSLPFPEVPVELKLPAVDLFRYFLLGLKQYAVSQDDRNRFKDAEDYLMRLHKGIDRLDIPNVEEPPAASLGAIAGRTGQGVNYTTTTGSEFGDFLDRFEHGGTCHNPARRVP